MSHKIKKNKAAWLADLHLNQQKSRRTAPGRVILVTACNYCFKARRSEQRIVPPTFWGTICYLGVCLPPGVRRISMPSDLSLASLGRNSFASEQPLKESTGRPQGHPSVTNFGRRESPHLKCALSSHTWPLRY